MLIREKGLVKMIEKIDTKGIYAPQIDIWEKNLDRYCKDKKWNVKNRGFCFLNSDGPECRPENTSLLVARMAIAETKNKEKKYVALQTFYDNGRMSTLDIVGMPLEYHKNIVHEYLDKVLTPILSRQIVPLEEGLSRFFIAGGFTKQEKKKVKFYGSSGDFSNQFSAYDVNDIAAYIASESGLFEKAGSENSGKGKEYVEKCLRVMKDHKNKPEFYEKLVDMYFCDVVREKKAVGPHMLYALQMMKSIDRAVEERRDIVEVAVEEMVDGIGRTMMLKGFATGVKSLEGER